MPYTFTNLKNNLILVAGVRLGPYASTTLSDEFVEDKKSSTKRTLNSMAAAGYISVRYTPPAVEVEEVVPSDASDSSDQVPTFDNGIWLQPVAGDPATPEDGVIGYNSTLGKFRAYEAGAWKDLIALGLPAGGTAGQALRKLSATDGDAGWSAYWVVDPTTGAMSSTLPDDVTPIDLFDTEAPLLLSATSTLTAAVIISGAPPMALDTVFKVTKAGNLSLTAEVPGFFGVSTQSGTGNIQSGGGNTQSGYFNTQSGGGNTQSGGDNTQSGYGNTQSGYYNTQSGYGNTQSGNHGIQSGKYLNDGGFNYTAMFGTAKTATVAQRAYFALDNGIWLKPVAGDAASPENGVICYNSTTHKFRGYANGAWVDLH